MPRCEAVLFDHDANGDLVERFCKRTGNHREDGVWLCWYHAPSKKTERKKLLGEVGVRRVR